MIIASHGTLCTGYQTPRVDFLKTAYFGNDQRLPPYIVDPLEGESVILTILPLTHHHEATKRSALIL